jgi:methylisocitrate lyase
MSKIGELLRNTSEVLMVPEIFDCSSAKAAEMNGFECIMISSADLACSLTGIPDLLLLSIDEVVSVVDRITNMTDMPLIMDADDGYGRPMSCYYACKRLAKAGAAGVLVTDAAENGRNGIAPAKLAELRMKAARDGLGDESALVIARCDVNPATDFEEFVERSNRYIEAGANMVCPSPFGVHNYDGDKTELCKKIGEAVSGWLWHPDLTADKEGNPEVRLEDLFKFGYRMTGIHFSLHASMIAMLDTGRHVRMNNNNVYVTNHYDYTGYKFFSPMPLFGLYDDKWLSIESRYVEKPEDALTYRSKPFFCRPDDIYDPDKTEEK